ncbi:unnamed protein product [Allacma fusca]|uniref:Uncharacterized protein n=1 Tax=Allacma fusca TaxID=39272 RepID=A0A8J2L991_9HEXA|nr:unnamed protein product [Allacma fusca]
MQQFATFRILLLTVVYLMRGSFALECYVCDFEEGQFGRPTSCENNPGREYLKPVPAHPPQNDGNPNVPFRPDSRFSGRYMQYSNDRQGVGGGNEVWFPYCVTIVGMRMGRKVVYRDYAWADTPQNDGQCEYALPTNYDSLYIDGSRSCYCNRADGCNNEPTSDLSDLRCYDCFWYELDGYPGSSPDCKRFPNEDKLTPIPRTPQMKLRSSYELSKMLDPKEFNMYKHMQARAERGLGRQQQTWTPYCVTLVAQIQGKEIVIRGAHWWEEDNKNGYCESDFPVNTRFKDNVGFNRSEYTGISMCYCNDKEGCNGTNKGSLLGLSSSVMIILSAAVYFYQFCAN